MLLHSRWRGPRCVLAATVLFAAACGGDGGTEPPPPPTSKGLRVVAGANVTDTALTRLTQALIVEVTDENGRPASGLVVRFEPVQVPPDKGWGYETLVASLSSSQFGIFTPDTTDAEGRASVLVQLGRFAGPARVDVSVPERGLTLRVTYTVLPGAAVGILAAPADTGVFIDGQVQLHGAVIDQHGNPRSDPVTYTASTSHISVSSSGLVAGKAYGRSHVVVQAGEFVDTTQVSVVPRGALAANEQGSGQLVLFNLDGSGYKRLTPIGGWGDPGAPAWAPSGDRVVVAKLNASNAMQIHSVTAEGVSTPLVEQVVGAETQAWATYSMDGQWVYFSGHGQYDNYSLWRAKSDGTGAERLWPDPVSPCCSLAWRPTPSPDGTRVAFVVPGAAIRVLDVATRTASSWYVAGQTPRWSPTREVIAFVQQYGGALSLMNADGTNVHVITAPGRNYSEGLFSWSPDGVWLAARGPSSIELLNIDTGLVIPLGYTASYDSPAWRPS